MSGSNFPRRDENLPPGGRRLAPPKNIATDLPLRETDNNRPFTPLNPMAQHFSVALPTTTSAPPDPSTQPIAYKARMPYYHPDYEDPIDGRYPYHFDPSAEFGRYQDTVNQDDGRKLGTYQIKEKVKHLASGIDPPLNSIHVILRTCTTSVARATAPPDTQPEQSPPLFSVYMDQSESHRWAEIYDDLKALLEAEFPIGVYPNCYPAGQIIIRFFHHGNDALFASSGSLSRKSKNPETPMSLMRQLKTPPFVPLTIPPTIEALYSPGMESPRIFSVLGSEPYCEFIQSHGSLCGSSLGVHARRGKFPVGTLGCFVLLKDKKTDEPIKDENGNAQVFGLTSSHVVQTSSEPSYPDSELQNALVYVTSLSKRDRENTFFSVKNRYRRMYDEVEHLEAQAKRWMPKSEQFKSLSVKKQAEIEDAYYTRENLKIQIKKDLMAKHDNVAERSIGYVYLAGGRRVKIFEGKLDDFTSESNDSTILSDFALIRMDPELYAECKNQFPEMASGLPHPAAADIARGHRTLKDIKSMKPEMVVMKSGRSTDITFGKIGGCRTLFKGPVDHTFECLAQPFYPGAAFCRQGDSGAAVMNVEDGSLVGMVMGGRPDDIKFSYVTPIQVIQADLAETFGLTMTLYMGHHSELGDIQMTDIDNAMANATISAEKDGAWEDAKDSVILGCGINRDEELCYMIKVSGCNDPFEVPRSMLNQTWNGKVKAWENQMNVGKKTPLKRIASRPDQGTPSLTQDERAKVRKRC